MLAVLFLFVVLEVLVELDPLLIIVLLAAVVVVVFVFVVTGLATRSSLPSSPMLKGSNGISAILFRRRGDSVHTWAC